jgi:hypothetical protein
MYYYLAVPKKRVDHVIVLARPYQRGRRRNRKICFMNDPLATTLHESSPAEMQHSDTQLKTTPRILL